MTASGDRIHRTVTFTAAEQTLLAAVDALIQEQHYSSFSDLCKQALQQFVAQAEPNQAVILFVQLQRQITQLELRLATLEQDQPKAFEKRLIQFDADLQTLNDRVDTWQTTLKSPDTLDSMTEHTDAIIEAEPEPEPDPLLSHLSGLLDDF